MRKWTKRIFATLGILIVLLLVAGCTCRQNTAVDAGAPGPDADWLAAFEAGIADADPSARDGRRAFAAANTWDRRADTLADFLGECIGVRP